jgi:hypothetical protein
MKEFFERYKLTAFDSRPTFANRRHLCSCGHVIAIAGIEVLAPSLAQKFGTGAILLLLDSLHLLNHGRR